MKKNISLRKFLVVFSILLIVAGIFGYSLTVLLNSSKYFENEMKDVASEYSRDHYVVFDNKIEEVIENANGYVAEASQLTDSLSSSVTFLTKVNNETGAIYSLLFRKDADGNYYSAAEIGEGTHPQTALGDNLSKYIKDEITFTEIYMDKFMTVGENAVCLYVPLNEGSYYSGLMIDYKVSDLMKPSVESINPESHNYFFAFIDPDGKVYSLKAEDDKLGVTLNSNLFDRFNEASNNQLGNEIKKIKTRILIDGTFETIVTIKGTKYVMSFVKNDSIFGNYYLLEMYKYKDLQSTTFPLLSKFYVCLIGLYVLSLLVLVLYLIERRTSTKKIQVLEDIDPALQCNSYSKFVSDAEKLLSENKYTNYAIVYMAINRYTYIANEFGKETAFSILKFTADLLKKNMIGEETFGHVLNETFAICLRYSDIPNLSERLKLLGVLVSFYKIPNKDYHKISASFGVYLTSASEVANVKDLVDRASLAQQVHQKITTKPFIIYDSSISSIYVQEAEIEANMNTALRNNDFKLFFQPKYNISGDRIDSAEVLVRWFNPEKKVYAAPDTYIKLFEANGFIAEVDKFVFKQTCIFVREMLDAGEQVPPLSVNVSRVTAMVPDFFTYYVAIKRKYHIPDGFITLEYTESFAYESYDTLKKLIIDLKKEGFKSSIDDFGVGYSAINILKELPVDELKLDKQLLKPTSDITRDEIVLKGIISMCNKLKIKIIQEGVETVDELKKINELGCNVIQGYYYSKPLHLTDYIAFMKKDEYTKLSQRTSSTQNPTERLDELTDEEREEIKNNFVPTLKDIEEKEDITSNEEVSKLANDVKEKVKDDFDDKVISLDDQLDGSESLTYDEIVKRFGDDPTEALENEAKSSNNEDKE